MASELARGGTSFSVTTTWQILRYRKDLKTDLQSFQRGIKAETSKQNDDTFIFVTFDKIKKQKASESECHVAKLLITKRNLTKGKKWKFQLSTKKIMKLTHKKSENEWINDKLFGLHTTGLGYIVESQG